MQRILSSLVWILQVTANSSRREPRIAAHSIQPHIVRSDVLSIFFFFFFDVLKLETQIICFFQDFLIEIFVKEQFNLPILPDAQTNTAPI